MWHYENLFQQQASNLKESMSPEVKKLKNMISLTLNELDNLQKQQKSEQENQYLQTYIGILKNISKEVILAKQKYLSIDRERLIAERKEQLSQSIIKTKGDINTKEKELARLRLELERMDRKNRVGQFQNECLKIAVSKKQIQSKNSKEIYLTSCRVNNTNEQSFNILKQLDQGELPPQTKELFFAAKKQKISNPQNRKKSKTFFEVGSVFGVKHRPSSTSQSNRLRQQSSKRKHTSLSYAFKYSKSNTNFLEQ